MSLRVLKFGGTSVGTASALRRAIARVTSAAREVRVVAVVSAFAGVTDGIAEALDRAAARDGRYRAWLPVLRARAAQLLAAAAPDPAAFDRRRAEAQCGALLVRLGELLDSVALLRRAPAEVRAEALAVGERLAAAVFAAGLAAAASGGVLVDAADLVCTDSVFELGAVDLERTRIAAQRRLGAAGCAVVPGFFGADALGRVVLLGRGGSDTTATVLGAVLGAERVEIWTDVAGVLTADPRRLPEARTLAALSYDDAADAAALGAKVLHDRALAPVAAAGIPIVVRSSFAEAGETWIGRHGPPAPDAFVVTTAPDLAPFRALRPASALALPPAPGRSAVLAAVGPAVAGRGGDLRRALETAAVAIHSCGCEQRTFIAQVREADAARGLTALHHCLVGEVDHGARCELDPPQALAS